MAFPSVGVHGPTPSRKARGRTSDGLARLVGKGVCWLERGTDSPHVSWDWGLAEPEREAWAQEREGGGLPGLLWAPALRCPQWRPLANCKPGEEGASLHPPWELGI